MNILPGLTNALKGFGGEFEINRVVGAFGTTVYVVAAQLFVAWNMINGKDFSLTEYCIAFPGGLAVCVGAIAGAVAVKDRNVAVAKTINDTGANPTSQAAADPMQVQVTNTADDPVPVESQP